MNEEQDRFLRQILQQQKSRYYFANNPETRRRLKMRILELEAELEESGCDL